MDGEVLCQTPCDEVLLSSDREAEVTITKRRHHDVVESVRLDQDIELDRSLERRRRSAQSRPPDRDSEGSSDDGGGRTQGEEDSGSLAVPTNF